MLKFADYLSEKEISKFVDYLSYLEESVTEPLERGSKSSFRGKLNEFAFVHAFNRYHDLIQKHKGDHENAMKELSSENHLPDNHEFRDKIDEIGKKIGSEETNRTLWDSHHAALATINHIHDTSGGITGAPTWSGVDQTGKTVEKLTGYNTPADMVVPTKKGWHHLSLKYSEKEKASPTKLSQRTADQIVEHIQNAHSKNFGERDKDLDDRLKELQTSFGSSSLNDKDISKKLNAAGFQQNDKGEFPKNKLSKMARYASEIKKYGDNPPENKLDRVNKLNKDLQDHYTSQGINPKEHAKHTANLADIYDNVLKSNKRKASISFMDALHNSVKKIYTQGSSGQHSMIKNLLNINPPGNGRFMVVKTQRSGKDYQKNPQESLPGVSVADHSKTIDSYLDNDKEHEAYDSVKTDKTASATIARKKGHNVASLALETSKSVPTLVASAGKDIDKFNSISDSHPNNRQSGSVTQKPAPVAAASQPAVKNAKPAVKQQPSSITPQESSRLADDGAPSGEMFGKSFHADHEKMQ